MGTSLEAKRDFCLCLLFRTWSCDSLLVAMRQQSLRWTPTVKENDAEQSLKSLAPGQPHWASHPIQDYLPADIFVYSAKIVYYWSYYWSWYLHCKPDAFSGNAVCYVAGPAENSGIRELNGSIALKLLHFTGVQPESQRGGLKISWVWEFIRLGHLCGLNLKVPSVHPFEYKSIWQVKQLEFFPFKIQGCTSFSITFYMCLAMAFLSI